MNLKVYSAIFILCLTWGYLWVPIKISLQNIPPFFFTSSRLLIGGLCLLIVQLGLGKSILPSWEDTPKLLILSCLMCIGYYGLSTFGMQYVDSGLSAILVYTMPIMIGVLAHFFLGEQLNKQKIIGLVFGLAGIFIILFNQLINFRFNLALVGELLLVASAFFWAWSTVYMKKTFQDYDKIKLTIWQLLIGGGMLYVISYMTENLNKIVWNNPMTFVYLGYSSILGTALAFLLWNWIVSKIDASLASISIMSVPLIGILFGHIQLHEPITVNILVGTFFICLGIIRCALKNNHHQKM
ncbi:DMT family transporter [Acinetobacter lactucae]|uniref:DMT family transporter n=1 Tax=Acinetobacter lactucae TaxID=1785128 RepID=UPI0015F552F6|nr:DMT family transporter [Acinetobacter lactucae]MDV7473220.1 DMT family transporter [Acinetobacter baumannii]